MKLSSLNIDIRELTGVGPKAQQAYRALGIETLADLITYSPKGYEDRSKRVCIGRQTDSTMLTNTVVKCISKSLFGKGLKSVKAIVEDTQTGVRGELLGFNRPFLDHMLYQGSYYHLYANAMPYNGRGRVQFSQFELKYIEDAFTDNEDMYINAGILPVYALTGSLTEKIIRRDIKNALSRIDFIDDRLPHYLEEKYRLTDYDSAIRKMHFPTCDDDIIQSRRTLAFTEVFYLQIASLRKPQGQGSRRPVEPKIYKIEKDFISSLPFSLTQDQLAVLEEIRKDMSSSDGMNRLLQGDVGSGKTLVAWVSALHAIAEGNQVAFMAPTELLARQHAQGAAKLLEKTGVRIAFLNGELHGKNRALLLEELKRGNIDLLIGTHALFSKDVEFRNLGYVIVDEQHRFGVEQRNALFSKGENPDILLMSATPIPRTLALTIYGNLNVSTIKTMPVGRLPVKTYLVSPEKREEMYRAIGVELERGHQAYFVYPRIEASEDEERPALRDVETMYEYLAKMKYPTFRGALIHSRLDEEEKIKILNDFSTKKLDFLVSTSVVEVGLDVPQATCMVVEHADIFGLSALHQLRGRVGRSTLQSWCFLAYEDSITEDGKKRLGILHKTNDGFEIAEEDLKIRGPGEITGLKQSGFINLRYASLEKDISMMACAREEVAALLKEDPGFINLENGVIRETLQELQGDKIPC